MIAARKTESKPKEQPVEGTHAARLLAIIDLGHQDGFTHQGAKIESAWKLEFVYELINHLMTDGRPFVVSEQLTNKYWEDEKTGRCTTLVSRAKSLVGKQYKEAMLKMDMLLGAPCMVTIGPDKSGYMKVQGQAGVGSLPFGMTVKELHNAPYIFSMDTPDMDIWEAMPEFKKNRITSALNFNESELARLLAEGDKY